MPITVTIGVNNSRIERQYLTIEKYRSEEELIQGCQRGERKAQDLLYEKYCRAMLVIAMRYCDNQTEAEDVLQEAFLKIFRSIKKFEGRHEGSLTLWIKTIVVNSSISLNRKNKKHNYTTEIEDYQLTDSSEGIYLDDEEMQNNSRVQKIMTALHKLPTGYRTVFNLYTIEGYSHNEIAEILDVSESTSKSQLSKARKYLRKVLAIEE